MTAFGYVRTSGPSQPNGDGPERQRVAIQNYAAAKDIQIIRVFEEKAIPGATAWVDRPAWMDMISSLNGTSTIIVEGLDRLARELGVQEYILAELTRRGVTLLSTHEDDVQNPDPSRVLFRQMMGSIYQFEKSMIVLKLKGARQRIKAATGKCEGQKAYGDKPGEGEILSFMKKARKDGLKLNSIVHELNIRDMSARNGGPWTVGAVHKILSRETQCAQK